MSSLPRLPPAPRRYALPAPLRSRIRRGDLLPVPWEHTRHRLQEVRGKSSKIVMETKCQFCDRRRTTLTQPLAKGSSLLTRLKARKMSIALQSSKRQGLLCCLSVGAVNTASFGTKPVRSSHSSSDVSRSQSAGSNKASNLSFGSSNSSPAEEEDVSEVCLACCFRTMKIT